MRVSRKASLWTVAVLTSSLAVVPTYHAAAASTTLLSGTVTGANGQAASGAIVTVSAWPTSAVQETYNTNDDESKTLPLKTVGTMKTGSSGAYSIASNLTSLGSTYTEPGGNVQTTFVAAAAAGSVAAATDTLAVQGVRGAQVSFNQQTARVSTAIGTSAAEVSSSPTTAQAKSTTKSAAEDGSSSANTRGNTFAGELATTLAGDDSQASASSDADATPGTNIQKLSTTSANSAASGPCGGWFSVKWYPKRNDHFTYLYTYHAWAYVSIQAGGIHETGIGVAVTGGNWSASGSESMAASAKFASVAKHGTNYSVWNLVNARHYARECVKGTLPQTYYYQHVSRMSSFFAPMTTWNHISPRSWNYYYCVSGYVGQSYKKINGSDLTYSTGFQAPFISLKSNSRYMKQTSIEWKPTVTTNICGNDNGWSGAQFAGAAADEHCKAAPGVIGQDSDADKPSTSPDC